MNFQKISFFPLGQLFFFISVLFVTLVFSPKAFSEEERSSFVNFEMFKNIFSSSDSSDEPSADSNAEYVPPFEPDPRILDGNPRLSRIIEAVNSFSSGASKSFSLASQNNLSLSTPCTQVDTDISLGGLSELQLCSKEGIYRQDYMRPDFDFTTRSPQFYMLRLDPDRVANYCQCVRNRAPIYGLNNEASAKTNLEQKSEVVDNLLKTGIDRLARRFNKIAPEVMYALTSLEMSSLHGKLTTEGEGEDERLNLEQKSALNSCSPGQFKTLMYGILNQQTETPLCNLEGAKRLGRGFIAGQSYDCQSSAKNDPVCQQKSSSLGTISSDIDPHKAISAIGNHISNSDSLQIAEKYLNRHHFMLGKRNRLEGADVTIVYDEQAYKASQNAYEEEWRKYRELKAAGQKVSRPSERENENNNLVQNALYNEVSQSGRELWKENNKPILRALTLLTSNGDVYDDQISGDMDFFREHLAHNPYLQQHFPDFQNKQDAQLKQDVVNYVKGPLSNKLKYILRSKQAQGDGAEQSFSSDDLNQAMFLTYRDGYRQTVEECEEIQKTLISLCQAATNATDDSISVQDFFTDPLLIDLYTDIDREAHLGSSSEQAVDMVAANAMFCQELNSEQRIIEANQGILSRQHQLADAPFLGQIRGLKNFLTNIGVDADKTWDMLRAEYLQEEWGETEPLLVNKVNILEASGNKVISVKVVANGESVASVRATSSSYRAGPSPDDESVRETSSIEGGFLQRNISTAPIDKEQLKAANNQAQGQQNDEDAKSSSADNSQSNLMSDYFSNNPLATPFSERFNNFDQLQTLEDEGEASGTLADQKIIGDAEAQEGLDSQVDPLQKELLAQLEKMRLNEEKMKNQIAELKESIEEDKRQKIVEKYEQEQKQLREKVEKLTAQLNEKRSLPEVTRAAPVEQGFNGALSGSRNRNANSSPVRVVPTIAPSSSQSGQTNNFKPISQAPARTQPLSSGSTAAGSGLGFTARSTQAIAQRSNFSRSAANTVLAGDVNLATIARSANGNTALRQTADPQILEKIIFKEVDGEIVFVDGEPVIEKTELVTLEEVELLAGEDQIAEDSPENERSPASLEEQMEEIEQSLYPRSRTFTAEELAEEIRRGKGLQEE